MEAEIIVNEIMKLTEDSGKSRSRSNTPFKKFNNEQVIEKRSDTFRTKQISPGPVTSTPNTSITSNNGLTAISESYSETVTYQTSVNQGKKIASTNSLTKSHRSTRPKAKTVGELCNGNANKSVRVSAAISNSITVASGGRKTMPTKQVKEKVNEWYTTGDYSSDEEARNKTIRTYRSAGEWWDTFPKTDYTYSPASEYRTREVAPGVLPLPNMSRRSLASFRHDNPSLVSPYKSSRTTTTTATTTMNSAAKTSRWFQASSEERIPRKLRDSKWVSADSDVDEVDEAVRAASHGEQQSLFITWFAAFWSLVVTTCTTCVETTRTALGLGQSPTVPHGYSTPTTRRADSATQQRRTFWTSSLDRLYMMCARVRLIDNWILAWTNRGSGTIDRTNRDGGRLRCLALLLLLPLLLFCGGWYCSRMDEAPLRAVASSVSDSLMSLSSILLIPFASNEPEKHQVTAATYQPLTRHPEETSPLSPTHATLATSPYDQAIDIDTLTTQIVYSHQMQLLLASHKQDSSNFESFVSQIIHSDQMKAFIAANQRDIDVKALTAEIVASGEMRSWLASNRKDVDLELLTFNVLSSSQMQRLLQTNQKEIDVELLVSQIIASGLLQDWLAANRKEAAVDIEGLVAKVVASSQLQKLVGAAVGEGERERGRRSLADAEAWKMQLQGELEKKDAQLNEQKASLSRLSDELSLVTDQMAILATRLADGERAKLHDNTRSEHDAALRVELRGLEVQLHRLREQQSRLSLAMRSCCNKPAPTLPLVAIEKHVTRFLAGVLGQSGSGGGFGGGNGGEVNADELAAWVSNVFVARKDLEARLANLTRATRQDLREASEHSAETIMASISDRISEQFVMQHQRQVAAAAHSSTEHVMGNVVDGTVGLSGDQVRAIVKDALATYDADKTGMVDYALESSGGQVLSTRCSETYYEHSATITLFGIPLWYHSNNPRSIIQPGVHPGECWAFRGSRGFAVIQLVGLVRISSFTLEHIPRSLAFAGNIDSAPKDFSVFGLTVPNDMEPTLLGKYTYQQNGTSLQYFIVQRTDLPPFQLIELQIESNHGNMVYTCLYRFRVHGTWVPE